MQVFLYKRIGDYLLPSQEGDVIVTVSNFLIKVYDRNSGLELKDVKFKLFGNEIPHLNKLKELEKATGIDVDENYALAFPNPKIRILKLNQLAGYVFEEHVYSVLSSYFNVKRYKNSGIMSLPKLGLTFHNTPDMLVEDKVVVEAKVGLYELEQIRDYERRYSKGVIVFPWAGKCKTSRWVCFNYFLKDYERVVRYIRSLIS